MDSFKAAQQVVDNVRAKIAKHGYTFIGVFDPERKAPNFVYSIGLVERGWPEVLMVGNVPPAVAESILTDLVKHWVDSGGPMFGLIPGMIRIREQLHPLQVVAIDAQYAQDHYAFQIKHFYPHIDADVVQVLWPDERGRFPNHTEYNQELTQPLLPVRREH